ncbi:RNA polymerase sigma factor [Sphingobacterium paludis]|uniref:RNA polymerase sigma-70 region 2 domain-containing protein n=1 Tax=Sphingobacterium paludis TaxID=1476465 RepID=A0A4R7CUN0_9SPHI|nr:hypothetical protein [Sphingobacterium paludis]TDS07530.1 hypothetical protein B0I21_11318 [Sphingobacterium paludis]
MGTFNQTLSSEFCKLLTARDRKAFELLYEQYGAGIYNLIHHCVGSEQLAKALFRDALCAIWKNLDAFFQQKETFFIWAVSIVGKTVNCHFDQHTAGSDKADVSSKECHNVFPINPSRDSRVPFNFIRPTQSYDKPEATNVRLCPIHLLDLGTSISSAAHQNKTANFQNALAKHIMQVLREARQAKQHANGKVNHKNSA